MNLAHNPHLTYRPDIDGLRAVAIILVIIFHAFPAFIKGGFIGVDIFFVISGYLITSIIFKAQDKGNFSLIDFYCRRIKRIFPALLVVLVFCIIFGWYSLLADEYKLLGKHIVAGAIYISNFILQGESGYFGTDAELKPLLHLWSLAIEEQFYVFFPLILIIVKKNHVNKLLVILVLLCISFILNIVEIKNHDSEVFFLPYYRIWELLIGSLVAYINIYTNFIKTINNHNSNYFSIFGIGLIIFGWFYLDSKKILFPSWWALLPTIGASFLIVSGEKAWFNNKVLANKNIVSIGLISYPLYLWHWPLLAFLKIIEVEKPKAIWRIYALIVGVFLSWLTYQFIEKKLKFLESRIIPIFLAFSMLLVGYIGYHINKENGYENRFSHNIENDKWLAEYNVHHDEYRQQDECLRKFGKFGFCVIKNVKIDPTVIIIGDSHANRLYLAFLMNKDFLNDNILNVGQGGCPPFLNLPKKECREMDVALNLALSSKLITTIVLSNKYLHFNQKKQTFVYNRLEKDETDVSESIYRNHIANTLDILSKSGKKIIYVLDVPELEFNPKSCMYRPWRFSEKSIKEPCAIPLEIMQLHREKYQNFILEILHKFPSIRILDPMGAFCDREYCWAFRNKKMLYSDSNHINEFGSYYLGDYFNKFDIK